MKFVNSIPQSFFRDGGPCTHLRAFRLAPGCLLRFYRQPCKRGSMHKKSQQSLALFGYAVILPCLILLFNSQIPSPNENAPSAMKIPQSRFQ